MAGRLYQRLRQRSCISLRFSELSPADRSDSDRKMPMGQLIAGDDDDEVLARVSFRKDRPLITGIFMAAK